MMWKYPFPWNVIVCVCNLSFCVRMFIVSTDKEYEYKRFMKRHPILRVIYPIMFTLGGIFLLIYLVTP